MEEIEITRTMEHISANQRLYFYACKQGSLDATYNQINRWFGIANIDVDVEFRRQGIGKLLLRSALATAQEVDARFIHAAIISRECLDAMESVFGLDALVIQERGMYEYADGTRGIGANAALWYEIK
jgi:GNAT superfamily N-acetyltransferase